MSLAKIFKVKNKFEFFTTPSHSQKFFLFNKLRPFYKFDISETDVYNPQEALLLAEKRASKIYKTKSTHFLSNGSTSGIIASVLTCAKPEDNVLIWKNAHQSHANAINLAGANPIFFEQEIDSQWGIPKPVCPELVEKELSKNKIRALIITSPTYEGVVSDIKKISEICKKKGVFLIIDEAHGALYPFSNRLPESAIYQGADFIIQSLHKTAGGLNPTALLHSNIDIDIKTALNKISTTSPSYPLLLSIEKNIDFVNSQRGRTMIDLLLNNIEDLKSKVNTVEFYNGDITKILIKTDKMSGNELSEFLYNNKIEDEKTNNKSTMLLCGIGTDLKKLLKLKKVLKKI